MEGESPREGFDEPEDEHLLSKERDRQRETDLYFKIPEAKPLLSKSTIDQRKPKILIRSIKIDLQYPELLNASIIPSTTALQRPCRRQHLSGESTLWRRYVIAGNFKCLYCKYRATKLQQPERRGKKLRLQLQKSTLGNQWLMATLIVDMAFLSDTTSYMARNLVSTKLVAETQKIIEQTTQEIVFDSAFQSGNLMYVFAKHDLENYRQFHLILQNDVNTKGYSNWFFFKLFSPKTGPIRFHLVNLQKAFSYFGQGMKPVVYSLREGKGWKTEGTNITYSKNDLAKGEIGNDKYSSLSFTIDQKHPNDTLVIAAAIPYTYSRLLLYLDSLERIAKSKPNLYFRRQILGKTISGNECPLITITLKRDRKEDKTRKKIVFIIARQHPSQIVSSWVCEGVLDQLINGSQEVQELLRKYIFKVVPMVNIDGVIYGNSRCDISGSDCNRKWTKTSNQALFPIVTAIRKLTSELLYDGYEIEYFIDLHGHSRKLGTFMYCCRSADEVQSRIFAWLMSKLTQKFVYQQCRFGVSAFRKETARGYFGSLLSNRKAITLQTSFFGYKSGGTFKSFTPDELRQLGHSLISTVHADTFRNNGVVNWATVRNEIRQEMNNRRLHQDEESSGSDSDPQGEELTPAEKANTYLAPTVATKIGLVDIKVTEKPNKRPLQSHSPELKRQKEEERLRQSIGPFDEHSVSRNLVMSQSLEKKELPSNTKSFGLRQTKSVTKIQPFKFKSLDKKPQTRTKKIRIVIDIQRMESNREPKKSAPSLPQVKPRNRQQFWTQMQQQFQTLLSQKQSIVLSAKAHLQQIEPHQ